MHDEIEPSRDTSSLNTPHIEHRKRPVLKEAIVDNQVSFKNIVDNLIEIGLLKELERLKYPSGERNVPAMFFNGESVSQEQIDQHRVFFQKVLKVAMPDEAIKLFTTQQITDDEQRAHLFAKVAEAFKTDEVGRVAGIRFPSLDLNWDHFDNSKSYDLTETRFSNQPQLAVRDSDNPIQPAMARLDGASAIFTHQEDIDFFIFCANKPEVFIAMASYFKAVVEFLENLEKELESRVQQGDDVTQQNVDDFTEDFIGSVNIDNFVSDILRLIVLFHLEKTQTGKVNLKEYHKLHTFPSFLDETITQALGWASKSKLFSHYLRKRISAMTPKELDNYRNEIVPTVHVTCPARTFVVNTLRGESAFIKILRYLENHPAELTAAKEVTVRKFQEQLKKGHHWHPEYHRWSPTKLYSDFWIKHPTALKIRQFFEGLKGK